MFNASPEPNSPSGMSTNVQRALTADALMSRIQILGVPSHKLFNPTKSVAMLTPGYILPPHQGLPFGFRAAGRERDARKTQGQRVAPSAGWQPAPTPANPGLGDALHQAPQGRQKIHPLIREWQRKSVCRPIRGLVGCRAFPGVRGLACDYDLRTIPCRRQTHV